MRSYYSMYELPVEKVIETSHLVMLAKANIQEMTNSFLSQFLDTGFRRCDASFVNSLPKNPSPPGRE